MEPAIKTPPGLWQKLYESLLGQPNQQAKAGQQEQPVEVGQAPNPNDKRLQFQDSFRKKTNY